MKLPPSLVPQLGAYPQASTSPLANMAAGQQPDDRMMQPVQPRQPRPPRPGGSLASMAAGPQLPASTY